MKIIILLDFTPHSDIIKVSKGKTKGVKNEALFDDMEKLERRMGWN